MDFYFEDANGHQPVSYDTVREVFDIALVHDIIERKGAWYHFGKQKWNGKDAVWKAMNAGRNPGIGARYPGTRQKCSESSRARRRRRAARKRRIPRS